MVYHRFNSISHSGAEIMNAQSHPLSLCLEPTKIDTLDLKLPVLPNNDRLLRHSFLLVKSIDRIMMCSLTIIQNKF